MRKSECKFYVTPDKRTICVYYNPFGGVFKGIAKLAEGDTYDKAKGEEIAFLKCKIKETKYHFNLHKNKVDLLLKKYYYPEIIEMGRLDDKLWKYWDRLDELSK